MTPALFIDLVLTPIGAGFGAALGTGMIARRSQTAAIPRGVAVIVGLAVAALVAGYKWMGKG